MRGTARLRAAALAVTKDAAALESSASLASAKASSTATLPLTREKTKWELHPQKLVVGVDEAGRGPLCGPVVAAAFAFLGPAAQVVEGVTDSKQIDEPTREKLYEKLVNHKDVVFGVGSIDHKEIDEINIFQAAMKAMTLAVEELKAKAKARGMSVGSVYIDGPKIPAAVEQEASSGAYFAEAVIKGDAKVYSIAAASIIAKVTRDRYIIEQDKIYPHYGFAQHKGYGVAAHMAALSKYGPCPIHRRTFAPIKFMVAAESSSSSSSSSSSAAAAASSSRSSSAYAAAATGESEAHVTKAGRKRKAASNEEKATKKAAAATSSSSAKAAKRPRGGAPASSSSSAESSGSEATVAGTSGGGGGGVHAAGTKPTAGAAKRKAAAAAGAKRAAKK